MIFKSNVVQVTGEIIGVLATSHSHQSRHLQPQFIHSKSAFPSRLEKAGKAAANSRWAYATYSSSLIVEWRSTDDISGGLAATHHHRQLRQPHFLRSKSAFLLASVFTSTGGVQSSRVPLMISLADWRQHTSSSVQTSSSTFHPQ